MPRSTVVAALIAALALPAAADAKTFHGKTNQRLGVTFRTGADGVPTTGKLHWNIPCKRHGYRHRGFTTWEPPFTQVTATTLLDGPKSYHTKFNDGSRARVTGTLKAHLSGSSWKGTLAIREVIKRKGKVINVCQMKRIAFKVS